MPDTTSTPPSELAVERLAGGNVRLRWDGPVGDGTRYHVWRQIDGTGRFTELGRNGTGDLGDSGTTGTGIEANTFTDTGVSRKAQSASYYIVARCEDRSPVGQSEIVTVKLTASEAA